MMMKMENERGSIVGFALAGLAIGAAAWYLFGTKEGRENFNRAVDGIGEVTSKLQKRAKEGMDYANDKLHDGLHCTSGLADEAKDKANAFADKVESATDEAKRKGKEFVQDVKDLADKTANSANALADDAKSKAHKYNS